MLIINCARVLEVSEKKHKNLKFIILILSIFCLILIAIPVICNKTLDTNQLSNILLGVDFNGLWVYNFPEAKYRYNADNNISEIKFKEFEVHMEIDTDNIYKIILKKYSTESKPYLMIPLKDGSRCMKFVNEDNLIYMFAADETVKTYNSKLELSTEKGYEAVEKIYFIENSYLEKLAVVSNVFYKHLKKQAIRKCILIMVIVMILQILVAFCVVKQKHD